MRKLLMAMALIGLFFGLGVSPAAAVVTQPPIQGSHKVTYNSFGACGTGRSLDIWFTITGDQFQTDKVVYHGPTLSQSPYLLLDLWLGVTGTGAGSGTATRVFSTPVVDGATATRTSNRTGVDWPSKKLERSPINNPGTFNYLDAHFPIGSGCITKFNLSSWSTYLGEQQITPGTYSTALSCDGVGQLPANGAFNYNVGYTVLRTGNDITLTVDTVTDTSTAVSTSHWIDVAKPTGPGTWVTTPVSAGTSITWTHQAGWPWAEFSLVVNHLIGQCQSQPATAGGL